MSELQYIYFRIFGYSATIVMHVVNCIFMLSRLQGEDMAELLKDPTIKFFNENQARYFTCWTFFLQIVYAVLGLCCDYLTLKNSERKDYKLPKHLKDARNILFSGVQWPATLLVSSMFWIIFTLNRELVLPEILDQVLSRASNHVIHTAIIPVMLWEIMFRPRTKPRSHFRNLFHISLHYVTYFAVLFYTYYETGTWIYPVFIKMFGTIYLPLFLLNIYLLLIIFYYIQWPITEFLHGSVKYEKSKLS